MADPAAPADRAGAERYSSRKLVSNAVVSVAFKPLILIIGVVRFAILIRLLPLDVYGAFILLTALFQQFDFMDGGLRQSLHRYIPVFLAEKRDQDVGRAVAATLCTMTVTGLLVGLSIAAIAFGGEALGMAWLSQEEGLTPESIGLLVAALVLVWPLNTIFAAAEGLNRFNIVIALQCVMELTRLGAVTWGALNGWSLDVLFVLHLVPMVLVQIGLGIALQGHLGHALIILDRGTGRVLREIFSYSKWMALGQVGSAINTYFDKLIVAAVLGIAAVPLYHGLRQVLRILVSLSALFHAVVLPTSSHLLATNNEQGFRRLIVSGSRAQNAFLTPFVAAIILFAEPVLALWAGDALAGYAPVLQIGAALVLIPSATRILNRAAMAKPDLVPFIAVSGIAMSVAVSLSIFLGGRWFGVGGAVIGAVLPGALLNPLIQWVILRRCHMPVGSFLMKGVIAGQGPALLVLIVSLPALGLIGAIVSVPVFLSAAVLWGGATLAVSFWFGMDRDVRTKLLERFTIKRHRPSPEQSV